MTTEKSEKGQKSDGIVTTEGDERSAGSETEATVNSGRRSIGAAIGAMLGFAAVSGISREALAQSAPVFPTGSGMTDVFWAVRIFALREYANAEGYQVAVLKGYDAIGDGGEGVFVWDALSTEADNTGIVVRPNAIAANEPGRWKRVVDGDWNVCWFGAKGDNATNNDDAFRAAIDAMSASGAWAGRYLYVPPGVYWFAATLHLNKAVALRGSSANANTGDLATQLRFPPGVTGVDIARPFQNQTGRGAMLHSLRITGQKRTSPADPAHGVRMRCVAQLDTVFVENFEGNGVDIYGNVLTQQTQSGFWALRNCSLSSNGQHGLYIDGPDASAGTAIALDVRDNGGWGILDSSQFGNTFIGAMSHNNGLGSYSCNETSNNRSVFVGCYSEIGQPASQVGGGAMVIGGHHSSTIVGWQQQRAQLSHFQVTTELAGDDLRLGQSGAYLTFRHETPAGVYPPDYGYYLKYVLPGSWMTDWYAFSYANADNYPIAFSSPRSPEGVGHAWLPNGVFLGRGASRIYVNSVWGRSYLPKKGRLGDVVFNEYVGSGVDADVAFWQCVQDGNGTTTTALWRAVRHSSSETFSGIV